MSKNYKEEHELIRQELWVRMAAAYVGAANATNINGPSKWADRVLEDFDERFKSEE